MAKAKIKDTGANLPAAWDEELAKAAEEESSRVVVSAGNKLSVRNKKWTFQGNSMKTIPPVVIVDFVYYYTYFDSSFNPDEITSPACFAIGPDSRQLHNDPSSPNVQGGKEPNQHVPGAACATCWANQFKTADQGKGKACGNRVKCAFIDAAGQIDSAYFEISPKGNPGFNAYVKMLADKYKVPPFGVFTQLSFDEEDAYPVIVCNYVEPVKDPAVIQRIRAAREISRSMLMAVPDVSSYVPPPQGKGQKGGPSRVAPAPKADKKAAAPAGFPARRNLKS